MSLVTAHFRYRLPIAGLALLAALTLALGAAASTAHSQAAGYSLSTPVSGSGIVQRSPAQATFDAGVVVTLTPFANFGWRFDRWEIDAAGDTNPLVVTMTRDKTVRAVFVSESGEQQTTLYRLTVELVGDCCGSVVPSQGETGGGVYYYQAGEDVLLWASTNGTPDLRFSHWEGDATGSIPTTTVRMSEDRVVRAIFVLAPPERYSLITNVVGSGSVTPDPIRSSYTDGEAVTLTAVPETGWRFDRWEGGVSEFSPVTTVTIEATTLVRAVFVNDLLPPTLTVEASGLGVVWSGTQIITVGGTAQRVYQLGDQVALTANPVQGWAFDRWTGDVTGTSQTISVPMGGSRNVSAVFVPTEPNIFAVSSESYGAGTVSRSPDDISYLAGERVTLTATPADGWRFDHWDVDAFGMKAEVEVSVSRNLFVRAVFAIEPIRYDLSTQVTGSGSVTTSPSASDYEPGSLVTLIAVPADNWRFDHWEGDAAGGPSTTALVMDGDRSVHAVFWFVPPLLVNVTTEISGDGTVLRTPGASTYAVGSEVQFEATAPAGWRFDHWEGDIFGLVNPIEFDVTGPMAVHAVFVPENGYALSVDISGSGSVASDPLGGTYLADTAVTLTAVAEEGWLFDHWELDAGGAISTTTVTMAGDRSVRAVFVPEGPGPGVYINPLPESGRTLAVFSGGTIAQASAGMVSIWVIDQGQYIGYLSDAPPVVNAAFMALYPDGGIPAGTPLYVVLR